VQESSYTSYLTQSQASKKRIKVLLVDDDAAYGKLVAVKLTKFEGREFDVVVKTNVPDALREIRSTPDIDIILCDYQLPELTGIDFCLQMNELGYQIPIIFITASRDMKLAVEAMKLGVENYILKEEASGTVVPMTLIAVFEAVQLRRQRASIEKASILSQKRAQAIKELVVTVSHEFNNPLAAIKISIDLLQRMDIKDHGREILNEFEKQFAVVQHEIRQLKELNYDTD